MPIYMPAGKDMIPSPSPNGSNTRRVSDIGAVAIFSHNGQPCRPPCLRGHQLAALLSSLLKQSMLQCYANARASFVAPDTPHCRPVAAGLAMPLPSQGPNRPDPNAGPPDSPSPGVDLGRREPLPPTRRSPRPRRTKLRHHCTPNRTPRHHPKRAHTPPPPS